MVAGARSDGAMVKTTFGKGMLAMEDCQSSCKLAGGLSDRLTDRLEMWKKLLKTRARQHICVRAKTIVIRGPK